MLFFQLGKQVSGIFNGSRHQLGKIGHIQGEGNWILLSREVPPVHVDGVAESLEGIEGNAHRQNQPQPGNPVGKAPQCAQIVDGSGEKVEIFEEKQQSQIHAQTAPQEKPAQVLSFPVGFDAPAAAVVHRRGKEQQKEERRVPVHIEKVRGCQEPVFPGLEGQDPVKPHHDGQINEKSQRIEIHFQPSRFSSRKASKITAISAAPAPRSRA